MAANYRRARMGGSDQGPETEIPSVRDRRFAGEQRESVRSYGWKFAWHRDCCGIRESVAADSPRSQFDARPVSCTRLTIRGGDDHLIVRRLWSPFGVQTSQLRVLASIWRPNRVSSSLLFSLRTVCK